MQRTFSKFLSRSMSGFTLIELLVVVAIIAVLIALLLPALGNARNSAKAAVCLSNQKQIGAAILSYANDYKDYIPAHYNQKLSYVGVPDYLSQFWHTRLSQLKYMPTTVRWDGYCLLSDVFHCPCIPLKTESELIAQLGSNGKWGWQMQTYGMREYTVNGSTSGMTVEKQIIRIDQPSTFFLIGDSMMVTWSTTGYQIARGNNGMNWRAYRPHQGKINTLMADGHAAPVTSLYILTQPIGINSDDHYFVWPEQ